MRTVNAELLAVDGNQPRLLGSRCPGCGECFLGRRAACEHCSGAVEDITLSEAGTLHSVTVVRYPPPGDYRGRQPVSPYTVGLVTLPEGVRILSRIEGVAPGEAPIGLRVRLEALPLYVDDDGEPVFAYAFSPSGTGG